MAFWNRKKRKQAQQDEERELEKQARQRLQQRQEKKNQQEQLKSREVRQSSKSAGEELRIELETPTHKGNQKQYVQECCQAIREADRQIEGIREEYQKVTESLMDIQKIDRMEGEERKSLLRLATDILKLTKERNQYKNRNLSISELMMRRFEPYEDKLVDEIKRMYEAEAYQNAIDGDMEKLEEEKKKIRHEKKEIAEKQTALKKMAKILIVFIVSLFSLFVVIYYSIHADMTFPYLGTIALAAVSSLAIFLESNRNRREMTIAERKMDKAVLLLNRVKIKCVNNRNVLEYNCQKFGVSDAKEFEYYWNEYCKAKEYERKFRENTEQLNTACEDLLHLLKEHEIQDCEVWISQVPAIIDAREMVEIRHKLNGQRQILREQIEYNENIKKEYVEGIDALLKDSAEEKEKLLEIVESYSRQTEI